MHDNAFFFKKKKRAKVFVYNDRAEKKNIYRAFIRTRTHKKAKDHEEYKRNFMYLYRGGFSI